MSDEKGHINDIIDVSTEVNQLDIGVVFDDKKHQSRGLNVAANQKIGGHNRERRRIRLSGDGIQKGTVDSADNWFNVSERIIQYSIRELAEIYGFSHGLVDVRDLESTVFARMLTEVYLESKEGGYHVSPQLTLFAKPVGLVSFQVHERRYVCVNYPITPEAENPQTTNKEYLDATQRLSDAYSTASTILKPWPTTTELLSILFDHLVEEPPLTVENDSKKAGEKVPRKRINKVHPARRSAIRDWQGRNEQFYTEEYRHENEGESYYTYPIVDMLVPDGIHLLLLFVSPLDKNFVDEKVGEDHRCVEITIAIYDVERTVYPGALEELTPFLKQAFARVLFTDMHHEASLALQDSIEAQSAILRRWVSEASEGYQALMSADGSKNLFDGMSFCEEVVKQILCAKIPGVQTEVYPFDRAFIFCESGISSRFDQQEPIEMLVLESSVLSNNPADRGRFLTRRERQIRGTEDYECDASQKTILDENTFRFYLHGHDRGLVLSRQKQLSNESLREVGRGLSSRSSIADAETRPFLIDLPDVEDDDSEFSVALHNLFGRLNSDNYTTKIYEDPAGELARLFQTEAFTRAFEQRRLQVTERFDDRGLYFHYDHGINLAKDIPILHRIQAAYSHYLDLHFRERDQQYRQEIFRQENLTKDQVATLLDRHRAERKQIRKETYRASTKEADKQTTELRQKTARAVYISFSWMLHDENMQNLLSRSSYEADGAEVTRALLSDEYRFTMILVADYDPEKSLAQLNAERENLQLFFQMIMHRVWVDKQIEHEYLEKRSQSISAGLAQFLHRAKALIGDQAGRQEIDNLYKSMKQLMNPDRIVFGRYVFSNAYQILSRLLGHEEGLSYNNAGIQNDLLGLTKQWFSQRTVEQNKLTVELTVQNIPQVKVRWPLTIVSEAFYVVFKNACEAALKETDPEQGCFVKVQLQCLPLRISGKQEQWFVELVIENSGGPIPSALLRELNSARPKPVGKNRLKQGSTGVGVYLARSQLHNTVGAGSEISFMNLEDRIVQTRLRLPVEVELTGEGALIPENETIVRTEMYQEYILYVEDNPEAYKIVVPALEAAVKHVGIALEHRRGFITALKLVETKIPRAIFSDLHIMRSDMGAEAPTLAYGIRFLRSVIEIAHERSVHPPILVLTAEDESTVRENLGDVTNTGYRFIPSGSSTARQLAQMGSICVFSGIKRPHELSQFSAFLTELTDRDDPTLLEERARDLQGGHDRGLRSVVVERVSLRGAKFDDLGSFYGQIYDLEQPRAIIVEDRCEELMDLLDALVTWFKHPGLPAPDPLLASNGATYRLTNHIWHKGLLLYLTVPKLIREQLSIRLLYWSLSNNIWYGVSSDEVHEVVGAWMIMAHEDRGPLSQLRHDLKNQWSSPDLRGLLKSTLVLIGEVENLLRYPELESRELRYNLSSGLSSADYLQNFLNDPDATRVERQELRQKLQRLDSQFPLATESDGLLKSNIDLQRQILQVLDYYLCGGL